MKLRLLPLTLVAGRSSPLAKWPGEVLYPYDCDPSYGE